MMQQLYLLPEEGMQHLLDKLGKLEATINQQAEKSLQSRWLDNKQLMALLKISKRTAQSWRDSGFIGFSQIGNKIFYKYSDVEAMLHANSNSAFSNKNKVFKK